jgi:AP-4 complex subunit epsilon-1
MYSVLAEILKRSDANSNIGNAILYEYICTITTSHVSPRLLEVATEITSRFVKVKIPLEILLYKIVLPACTM